MAVVRKVEKDFRNTNFPVVRLRNIVYIQEQFRNYQYLYF